MRTQAKPAPVNFESEGVVPLSVRRAWSLSNTMWPRLRPIRMRSFILIHPTVWPRYNNFVFQQNSAPCTNVTDRQDRTGQTDRQTDNGPIGQGEPFYKRSPKNESCSYQA